MACDIARAVPSQPPPGSAGAISRRSRVGQFAAAPPPPLLSSALFPHPATARASTVAAATAMRRIHSLIGTTPPLVP